MKKTLIILFLSFTVLEFGSFRNLIAQDIKVACIGNSITMGQGTITFPYQLDVLLGEGWDVVNYGISGTTMLKNGDNTYWDEQAFADAVAFQPDKVIIKLGTNDSKYYNWTYKDEFYTDYLAMVDSFAGLDSHPEIYICTPAKAFSGVYDINNTVIHDEIIPLIDSVANNRDVQLIDLYSFTENVPYYFSDGVHPNSGGNNYIARILFNYLVDSSIVVVSDTNVALNTTVASDQTLENSGANLTDGELANTWIAAGLPVTAIIDLGSEKVIDNFQLLFSADANKGYQYTIEGSLNSTDWTMLADQSERDDTITLYSRDTLEPDTMRYIRLTFPSFSNSDDDTVRIIEFKALQADGYEHAPTAFISKINATAHTFFEMPQYAGDAVAYYEKTSDINFYTMVNFTTNTTTRLSLYRPATLGKTYMYYTVNFYDGIMVCSDVSKFTYENEEPPISNPGEISAKDIIIFPNPSGGMITFTNLPVMQGKICIKIFDSEGSLIRVLTANDPGAQSIQWDGRDQNSASVLPGMYLCVIENGQEVSYQKLIVLDK